MSNPLSLHDALPILSGADGQSLVGGLRAVLAAADELLACPDTDTLLRRAVELARQRLGLERCSIFLEAGSELRGTYGTDRHGVTSDERASRIVKSPGWRARLEALCSGDSRWALVEEPHSEWDGERMAVVGEGWIAATPIRCSSGRIGFLFNDTAISGAPVDPVRQETAAVF